MYYGAYIPVGNGVDITTIKPNSSQAYLFPTSGNAVEIPSLPFSLDFSLIILLRS